MKAETGRQGSNERVVKATKAETLHGSLTLSVDMSKAFDEVNQGSAKGRDWNI